jgi:hypothetical protein
MILSSFIAIALQSNINTDLALMASNKEALAKQPWAQQFPKLEANHHRVIELINSNLLKTADEYRIASENLLIVGNDYESVRVQYELQYTASVMGDTKSRQRLAASWDLLLMSLGRKRALESVKDVSKMHNREMWKPQRAPDCVRNVWLGSTSKLTASDNLEIKNMFKADQEIRQGDLKQADFEKMMREDTARLKRIKEMVSKNLLKTANDFHDAAFLYQHGESFDDYQMAHQLSVCSVLLGRKDSKWIGAASYDRMLRSIGHKQRWATQYRMIDSKLYLQGVDSDGICENQRQVVVGKTLAQAQAYKD